MSKRRNGKNGNENNNEGKLLRKFRPKTVNQSEYVRSIAENDVIICTGPAGSGKTAVAVGLACEYLVFGKIHKVIITRPTVETGKGLGALPGDMHEKIHPYLIPIIDEMSTYFHPYEIQGMIKNGIVEVVPLEYMRGRNFHKCMMILDEGQNATLDQIKMFITRIGKESKCIVNGDLDQTDLKEKSGLKFCVDRLDNTEGVGLVKLTTADIIRHSIIARILAKLEK